MRSIFILFLLNNLLALNACAQETPRFYVEVNPAKASVGQPIVVTFKVQNGSKLSPFTPPNWDEIGLSVYGNSQSSSISIVNGETTASISYAYTVAATDTGTLVIPSVSIRSGETELKTEPITLQITPGNADGPRPLLRKNSPAPPPPSEPKKKIKTIKM